MAGYALPSDIAREYLAQLDAAERAELIEHISSMLAESPYELRRAREAPVDAPPPADAPPSADAPSADAAPLPLISLTRTFALDDDPRAAIAINDAHRNADVGEDDLWSIDQVRTVLPRQYKYPVPTFAPRRWPTAKPTTQSEYNVRFQAEYPEVASILPISNVVVAGGAGGGVVAELAAEHVVAAATIGVVVAAASPDGVAVAAEDQIDRAVAIIVDCVAKLRKVSQQFNIGGI